LKKVVLSCILLGFAVQQGIGQHAGDLSIWFDKPAEQWDHGLFFGNGSLGGIVFGGTDRERIVLNEESVWSRSGEYKDREEAYKYIPLIRQLLFKGEYEQAEKLARENVLGKRLPSGTNTYQELAELSILFEHQGDISHYVRTLNIKNATVGVFYEAGGVQYKREIFSSAIDKTIFYRISASRSNSITALFALSREESKPGIFLTGREITLEDHLSEGKGVRLNARLRIYNTGGTLEQTHEGIRVKGADEVLVVIAGATDYRGDDPALSTKQALTMAGREYESALQRHLEDYQALFNRFSLDLGNAEVGNLPTDERLERIKKGGVDPGLISLYVQFARYLLISSSRPGSLPANLQGLWVEGITPPWNADYHININIQMNYWPAEVTNLAECHMPLFDFAEKLVPSGRITARQMYGASGWAAHHTSDVWHFTTGFGEPQYGFWPMSAGWLGLHFWEHYQYSGEIEFLKNRAYPLIKEASEFYMDYLVKSPVTGYLVSGPSISPENSFVTPAGNKASLVMGPSMDHQIIWENFNQVITASEILDIDENYRKKVEKAMQKLTPPDIDKSGRIMEWAEELKEAEPGHRHMSHLFALHPGSRFNWRDTPEFMEASGKVIEERLRHGGGHTGWSKAWMINFYARLQEAELAHENLLDLFKKSTLPNLLDVHPPFQIDGNFGAAAGVVEMLLQSHAGEIHLLPALPKEWPEGSVKGLRARGGFEVDIAWREGAVSDMEITSLLGNSCVIRIQDKIYRPSLKKGETIALKDLQN